MIEFKNHRLKISFVIIIIGTFIALFIFGQFDKFFIKKSFEKAFFYRMVGNCEAFINYISVDKNDWQNRCEREKNKESASPIRNFKILRVDYLRDNPPKALLQVELTRDEGRSYIQHYEMVKFGVTSWKITNEFK